MNPEKDCFGGEHSGEPDTISVSPATGTVDESVRVETMKCGCFPVANRASRGSRNWVRCVAGTILRGISMCAKTRIVPSLLVLSLLGGWVVGLGCYPFVQWSALNCRHEDLDINTGRIRHQRFLLGLRVKDRIEESAISRAVQVTEVPPDWRRVNTVSPLVRYSPHYRLHGGIAQIRYLEMIWEMGSFTPSERSESARTVLRLWKTSGCVSGADSYLNDLFAVRRERPAGV